MELDFEKNINGFGILVRVLIGLALLILIYLKILRGWLGFIAKLAALVHFLEAVFSYCMVYDLMGWSDRRIKKI